MADRSHVFDPTTIVGDISKSTGVNWLGASYSGTDIKVVAHLYGSRDEAVEELEKDLAQASDAHDAFLKISSLVITANSLADARKAVKLWYPTATSFVRDAAQMKLDSTARGIVSREHRPFLENPFKTKARLASLAQQYNTQVLGLMDRIDKLMQMEEASSPTLTLGALQTISIQSHREKVGVRALGTGYVKGYTRGPRSIAGSMIFTIFDEHALKQLLRSMKGYLRKYGELDYYTSSMLPDQLPPLDLTIVFANEYGSVSKMAVYGVEFLNDGVTFSIEDLFSEQVLNFVARDVDVMTRLGQVKLNEFERGMASMELGEVQDMTATDLAFSSRDAYNKYLDKIGMRRRFKNR